MARKKLLYVGRSLPCRTETFVFNEVLELKRLGWYVDTLSVHAPETGLGSPKLDEMAECSLVVYPQGVFPILFRFLKEAFRHPFRTMRTLGRSFFKGPKVFAQTVAALSIAEDVREKQISHIHSHMAHVPTTMAWVLGAHLEIPYSFTGHAADLFRDRVLLEEKLKACAFCVCISRWHRKFYQKIAPVPDARLPIIYCGVDLTQTQSPAPEKGSIFSVGRLVPKKGFRYLIEALSALRSQGKDFHCRIIGEGPQRAELERLIEKQGLGGYVELMGARSHQEILSAISKAELFVLPCIVDPEGDRDGIPLVLMEAMAGSVPVISGDLPTIRELIDDGKNGLLVNPKNPKQFAGAIGRVLEDVGLNKSLAEEGRKKVGTTFDLQKNTEKLASRFEGNISHISKPKLLFISPCRNEVKCLRRSLDSILRQTLLPAKWVIVDDGSTDGTSEILEDYANKHPFIKIVKKEDRGSRRVGPGVVEAFDQGLESEDWESYDYVCKLDLDLELPDQYFELLIERMEANPRLGTCSGKAYYEDSKGNWISEGCGDEMSQGMTKLFKTECFREIGGFVPEVMWDGIDCHRCRMLGWQAASWDEPALRFLHLRPMGSSQQGIVTGRMRHGFGQYFMGTGPVYMLASSLYRMAFRPFVIGGVSMFLGYLQAWWKKTPRYDDPAFRRFLRAYQWKSLFLGKRRATKITDKKQENKWLENHGGD